MDETSPSNHLDPAILAIARAKSRRIAGRHGIEHHEIEDVEQTLVLHFLRRRHRFDPHRAKLATFADRVMTRYIANEIASRRAARRDYRKRAELSQIVLDDSRIDSNRVGGHELLVVQCDIARAISRLSSLDQRICHLIANGASSVEVIRELRLSPASFYRRRLGIRDEFVAAGVSPPGFPTTPELNDVRQNASEDGI